MLVRNFVNTWYEAGLRIMDFGSFEHISPNVPKQKTCNDCGIFAIKLMELFCRRNPTMYAFSAADIPDIPGFRKQLAADIVFNQHNKEVEAKNMIQNFNPKVHKRTEC